MKKAKQILAIIVVVILVLMYILSLIFAMLQTPNWQRMFFASMGLTVLLPVFAWFWIWAFKHIQSKRELKEGEVQISHGKIRKAAEDAES